MTTTAADLAAALAAPGLINEDVVQTVYNLDTGIPTVLMDAVGMGGEYSAPFSEWTEDATPVPDPNNAKVDGADASGNRVSLGKRVGNHGQISDSVVDLSHRSEAVNSIGGVGGMAYQTAKVLLALRRDVEVIANGRQGSQADDGNTTPGLTAGLAAWLTSNVNTSGDTGGFNTTTKLVEAPVAGVARAMSWEGVRDLLEMTYTKGSNVSRLQSVPGVIKRINSFLFSDDGKPYRADPTANVTGTGGGATQTAQGFISVVLSDFGISLSLVDNRLQPTYDSADAEPVAVADVFLIDPAYFELATLEGFRNDELGKKGLSDQRLLSVDWKTRCLREDAHACYMEVDPTQAVTA